MSPKHGPVAGPAVPPHANPIVGVGRNPAGGAVRNNPLDAGGRSRLASQSLGGNTVNLRNHNFNLGGKNYLPASYRHNAYHGYWNGNYGFGGGYPNYYGGGYGPGWGWGLGNYGYGSGYGYGGGYGYRPLGWGLGAWGLGSLAYNSGYMGYYNPYYGVGTGFGYGGSGYNYAQPIPVVYSNPTVVVNQPAPSVNALDAAIAAFQQADYNAALDLVNQGLTQEPNDSVMHEFRALVLFAQGDYQRAATTIHSVLAVGPGWDWTTMAGMYSNINLYTDQLRALESAVRSNPQDGAPHFLLAYHYMTIGQAEAAATQLQQVVAVVPTDQVAADILKMISAPPATPKGDDRLAPPPAEPTPESPAGAQTTPAPDATPVDPAMLVGTWKATREEGSTFELTLAADSTFVWKFTAPKQPAQEFNGTYTMDVNVLALEKSDGGSLIAEVSPKNPKTFNFKLVGAPPQDKGLDFRR